MLLRLMRRVACASGAAARALIRNRKQTGIGTAGSGKVALRRRARKGVSVAAARRTALHNTKAAISSGVLSTRVRCRRERVAQIKPFSATMQR
jgi:hypothetical protein